MFNAITAGQGIILGALALSLLSIASVTPAHAQNPGYCQAKKDAMPKIEQYCAGLNTNVTLDGNPFVYTNPDAGCDLGLSLPGLPNFGAKEFGVDSCKILKAVTGDLVRDINSDFQDAVDSTLGSAADQYNSTNINPEDYITDQVN